ncbi:MAG: hypothetical protein LBV27_01370, partial [Oscillospiraceae bacterium]|nr:hypothetical protein [Oscillospiraceae bacterium]
MKRKTTKLANQVLSYCGLNRPRAGNPGGSAPPHDTGGLMINDVQKSRHWQAFLIALGIAAAIFLP